MLICEIHSELNHAAIYWQSETKVEQSICCRLHLKVTHIYANSFAKTPAQFHEYFAVTFKRHCAQTNFMMTRESTFVV